MIPEHEEKLDRLFRAYREATDYGDVSANFMPELWARIESRRASKLTVERVARIFASAALAIAMLLAVSVSMTPPRQVEETWVETIANHNLAQQGYSESVRLSPVSENISYTAPEADQR